MACERTPEEVDIVFKWNEGDGTCTREFNTIFTYFLPSDTTMSDPMGMSAPMPGTESKNADDCCKESAGATNAELVMACHETV